MGGHYNVQSPKRHFKDSEHKLLYAKKISRILEILKLAINISNHHSII